MASDFRTSLLFSELALLSMDETHFSFAFAFASLRFSACIKRLFVILRLYCTVLFCNFNCMNAWEATFALGVRQATHSRRKSGGDGDDLNATI